MEAIVPIPTAEGAAVATLALHPNANDPLKDLQPMPSREDVVEPVQVLWDVLHKNRRRELGLERLDDYTQLGEEMRAALSNVGDRDLVRMIHNLCNRLAQVNHPLDLRRELEMAGRKDLLEYQGTIRKGADVIDDDVRQMMKSAPHHLVGNNYTHTEVKQGAQVLDLVADPQIRKQEELNALDNVRVFEAEKRRQANAHTGLITRLNAEIAKLVQQKAECMQRVKDLSEEGKDALRQAEELQQGHKPIHLSRLKRARETALGLLTQPNKRAAHAAAGKTLPGTPRDTGLHMALGIDFSSDPSEIKFNRVANGFLHTATGNRLAQHVAAVNTLASAEVGTTGSPWESCADDALAEIIRGAQAAMQQRAEAKAAAAAVEAAAAAAEEAAAAEAAAAEAAAAASSPVPALSPVLAEMAAHAAAPVA